MPYDNKDSGALWKHEKRGNEKAPDYSGKYTTPEGKERRIAAWLLSPSWRSMVSNTSEMAPNTPSFIPVCSMLWATYSGSPGTNSFTFT